MAAASGRSARPLRRSWSRQWRTSEPCVPRDVRRRRGGRGICAPRGAPLRQAKAEAGGGRQVIFCAKRRRWRRRSRRRGKRCFSLAGTFALSGPAHPGAAPFLPALNLRRTRRILLRNSVKYLGNPNVGNMIFPKKVQEISILLFKIPNV